MIVKSIKDVESFIAGDGTKLQEVLHPKNDNVALSYSLAKASLGPGEASDPHILKTSSELYVIEKGRGRAFVGEEVVEVTAGDLVLVPEGVMQHIENIGVERLEFLCIVSPPWSKSDEVIY